MQSYIKGAECVCVCYEDSGLFSVTLPRLYTRCSAYHRFLMYATVRCRPVWRNVWQLTDSDIGIASPLLEPANQYDRAILLTVPWWP